MSFEGVGAVKLQDPFTFDDNGELIPLSKRFDEGKPDMRWKVDAKAEADAWAGNPENVRKAAEKYLSEQKGQIVVDPDRIRQLVPNYDISDNSSFVAAGDEILEVVWAEALKRVPKDKPVVLLTGNPAAGKGTAKKRGLLEDANEANLVFDAPQNGFESVEKRVRQAIDAGHCKSRLSMLSLHCLSKILNALTGWGGSDCNSIMLLNCVKEYDERENIRC